jgi:hypothetical protein
MGDSHQSRVAGVSSLLAGVVLLALFLQGCAGYRMGPTNGMSAGSRTVQVVPFQNKTYEPRLSAAVTSALRKRFQQDGTFKLATQNDGDIILTGVITDYKREPVALQPNDLVSVQDYEEHLYAVVTAEERGTGKKLFEKTVQGRTLVRVGADLGSAERQAAPLLAEDLARNAASLLIDGSW